MALGNDGRTAHVGATRELRAVAPEIVRTVRVMDGRNRQRFAQDAALGLPDHDQKVTDGGFFRGLRMSMRPPPEYSGGLVVGHRFVDPYAGLTDGCFKRGYALIDAAPK